jgi:sirohydrochlorin ferrochelatase
VKRAILLVDHGSRRPEANRQLERIARLVAERVPDTIVRFAHMELAPPDVAAGVAACAAAGARELVVHP